MHFVSFAVGKKIRTVVCIIFEWVIFQQFSVEICSIEKLLSKNYTKHQRNILIVNGLERTFIKPFLETVQTRILYFKKALYLCFNLIFKEVFLHIILTKNKWGIMPFKWLRYDTMTLMLGIGNLGSMYVKYCMHR